MSKAMVGYLAAIALALVSIALIVKKPSAPADKSKSTLQSKVESRKQALEKI